MNAVETLRGRGALVAVHDAHGHLLTARERVEELRTSVRSAIRVADDIDQLVNQARSGSEHDDDLHRGRHLDAAAEDLARLRSRCEVSEGIVTALSGDLDKAAAAVTRARDLVTGKQAEVLLPRLEAIEDSIDATRQIADAAAYHLRCAGASAGEISADVSPGLVTRPHQLQHRLTTADRRLERVDEDVRLLDLATGRATTAASRTSADVATLSGFDGGVGGVEDDIDASPDLSPDAEIASAARSGRRHDETAAHASTWPRLRRYGPGR